MNPDLPPGPYPPPPPPGPSQYPPPPPPGYYPPPYPYAQPVRTSGMAIASLVLGIVWVYWITSVLAVIFGHVALGEIKRSGGTVGGRGMAIAGLVLGYVWLGFLVFGIFAGVMAGALFH